ncbi:hypothetical protein D3C81_2015730 [compost metagenome]
MLKLILPNPYACIGNINPRKHFITLGYNPDAAARIRIFHSILQQVEQRFTGPLMIMTGRCTGIAFNLDADLFIFRACIDV